MAKERIKRVLSIILVLAMVFTVGMQSSAYAQSNDVSMEPKAIGDGCAKYKAGVDWDKLVSGKDYVPGKMIVTFSDDLETEESIYEIIKEYDFEVEEVLGFCDWKGGKTALITIPENLSVPDAISEIETCPAVRYATPDGVFTLDSTPNDTYYSYQWHIGRIDLDDAWDIATCDNEVTVAVLDTGIDLTHPDLAANILSGYAWNVVTNSPLTGDLEEHGTHVAGIVSAVTNNNLCVAGTSYNANIIPVVVYEENKMIETTEDKIALLHNFWKGVKYIINDIDCETVKVINISGGTDYYYYNLEEAINAAAYNGIITVCAAGNFGGNIAHYPSDYEACISVMSTEADDTRSDFSNYGLAKDICAPGRDILSTIPTGLSPMNVDVKWGTSMSAPIVSGVIALMYSANPNLTNDQVKHILYSTAVDLGAEGKDMYFGWGRVNAYAAVLRACEGYWERISGTNRYFTMKNLSKKGWDDNSCDTVIVATGLSFPDALAATALAGVYDCPLLLTLGDTLSPQAASEIQRLGANDVIIVGGTGAVSNDVKTSIEGIVGAGHVTRLSGSNRFATAYNIYNSCVNEWSDTLIVATGMSAADVLSIAPYAYASKSPIFLADQNGNLSSNMQGAIQAGNFGKAVIIGSSYLVSTQTETLLTTVLGNGNVYRISGSDRYITSSMVADWESGENVTAAVQPSVLLDYNNVSVVNGADDNYPDALAGGPFCGHNGAVMLLTQDLITNNNYTVQNNVIPHTDDIEIGYIIGGTGALSAVFEGYLESLCQ